MQTEYQNNIKNEIEQFQHIFKKQNTILVFVVIFIICLTMIAYIVMDSYFSYQNEKNRIEQNYIALQKDIIKSRVDDVVYMINSSLHDTEADIRNRIKDRVIQAFNIANSIYDKYHNIEPEDVVKNRIKDALRPLSWNNKRSYIWIVDYNNTAILSPENKQLEGKSLANIKDLNGKYVVKEQTKNAILNGEAFDKDYFTKYDQPQNMLFPQLSYVKSFGHYDWYFGSAEFIDDYTQTLKTDLLNKIAKIRYPGDSYIFITDYNGSAMLTGGKMVNGAVNILNVKDKNGFELVKEELKIGKTMPEGGFLRYVWHEESVNRDIDQISFIKGIPELDWTVGTYVPIDLINVELANLSKEYIDLTIKKVLIVILFFAFLTLLITVILKIYSEKLNSILSKAKNELISNYAQLSDMNLKLKSLVDEETKKRLEQERLLMQQSRLASIGEMIGNIAHQWRQPLNQICAFKDSIVEDFHFNELSHDKVDQFNKKINTSLDYMSQTIDDFRNFFKPDKEKHIFDIKEAIAITLSLVSDSMKSTSIVVGTNMFEDDLKIFGYKNEFSQVLINILNNAKDALRANNSEDSRNIWISAYRLNNSVCIEILDNAGGIPKDLMEKIFYPYFTTKHAAQGTGLGLYMSKMIIEQNLSGTLKVENEDVGAKFIIELYTNN